MFRIHVWGCDNIYARTSRRALSAYSDLDVEHIRLSLGYVPLRSGGMTSMIRTLASTILYL